VVSRRGVFRMRWVIGGGRYEGLYKGKDERVHIRYGSVEVGAHAGAFIGAEEGGGGGCEGVFECWLGVTPFPLAPISFIRSAHRCYSLNVYNRSTRSVYALNTTWNKYRSSLAVTT